MKWIKSRYNFLNEAKIRDVVHPKQIKLISDEWGEKFLDYEEIEPTKNINQGYWKLDEDDKYKVINMFISAGEYDIREAQKLFKSLPDKFVEILNGSLDVDSLDGTNKSSDFSYMNKDILRAKECLKEFDIRNPSVDEIVSISVPVFRKLSNETNKDKMIQRDGDGKPIYDENNKPLMIEKEIGFPIYSNNLINITSFIDDYNKFYDDVVNLDFNDPNITSILNRVKEDVNGDYKTSFKIFDRDVYLKISHNAKDILNMSISKFYSSCQHLYNGMYKSKVLGNVFDPNTIPAFLVFDTPIYNGDDLLSEQLPISRMLIRNIERFDSDDFDLFFDRAYVDRMKDIFDIIVEKYSGNINSTYDFDKYIYSPDINLEDSIAEPYHDHLGYKFKPFIGVNTKRLTLTGDYDWSSVEISPKSRIKELIISNPILPKSFSNLNFDLDWIKIKYIKINDLSIFNNFNCDSIIFERCKFDNSLLKELIDNKSNINNIGLISCEIDDDLNLSGLDVNKLTLVYTFDGKLRELFENVKFKELEISGDLMNDKDNKDYINYIKGRGTKVKITGLLL